MGSKVSLLIDKLKNFRKLFKTSQPVSLTVLGLDAAGKTSLLKLLKNADMETVPTLGFSHEILKIEDTTLRIWDIGGQDCFMRFWVDYIKDVNGLIFVIDISDDKRFDKAFNAFQNIESHLPGSIPILLLLNKTDLVPDKATIETRISIINQKFCIQSDEINLGSKKYQTRVVLCSVLDESLKVRNEEISLMQSNIYCGIKWVIEKIEQQ